MVGVAIKKPVEGSTVQIITMDCLASSLVDDLVRIDEANQNTVLSMSDNTLPKPVIGMIIEKITATSCKVAVSGVFADPESTTSGVLYISTSGILTRTPPISGYRQKIGYSLGNGLFDLKPEKTLIKVNP